MYLNLEKELRTLGVTKRRLAEMIKMPLDVLLDKLDGYEVITLDEASNIKEILCTEKTIEELFATGRGS